MFEKKRGKRFLASVMALVMLLSLAPVGALAYGYDGPGGGDNPGGDNNGISVNLKETNRGECNVYYAETKTAYSNTSTDQTLTELSKNGSVTHDNSENLTSYGVIFFVAPHDGYAVEGLDATASAGIYQSIVNNENPRQTDFWTKNSQIENLTSAGFTEEQIEALVQAAKDRGCVAAFIFTRSASNRGDIDSELNFTTHQLATFEKSITAVKSGDTTYTKDLNNVKVRVGDVITYSFEVTFYPDGNNITYSDIVVTDERLGGEGSQIAFTDSASAETNTQTQTREYTVTPEDISKDELKNTATLTYNYTAPYNVGAVNATATATATIATVSAVSYQYDDGPRPSDATDVTTGVYAPTEHSEGESVTVAANPTGTGYTFSGWTAPGDVTVNDNGTFTMPDKSITFTGKWIANKHSVTYKDGTETLSTLSKNDVAYDTNVTVKSYSKEGYKLTGWKSDADNITYSPDQTFTMPDKDVTLTAVWEEDTTTTTEPENPTSEINAMYFVLTPSMTAPTDGSSKGVGNYFPNDSDCGGVKGKTTRTGYPGKIKSTLLNDYPTVKTQAGYADTTNGIGADYLVLPDDLGYFSRANYTDGVYTGYNKDSFPNVLKNLVGEGNQFNMNNYQIVWYVVKKESNGYHVDGYLKGVSIQLKYIDTFGGTTTEVKSVPNLKSGDTVTIESQNIITANRTGWTFEGWTTNADGTGKLYKAGDEEILITSTSLYAKWTNTYTVVTHFKDAEGTEQEKLKQTKENLTGTSGKLLSELVVQPDMTNITGTYVYVPSETKYSVGNGDKVPVGTTTFTEANTVIHQYYYLDKTGKTDEKGKDTNEPNNYPDAWEYKATFIVKNGQWDTNPTGGSDTIVKYLPTKKITTGESIPAKLSNVPTAGNTPDSHYKAGSWDQKPNEGEVITKDMTYTYTYSWRSSGGSGGSNRPKPPVVEIPDDVPTGLNGKDHYAYIIGYGNNDVRPQNNITRAEVATIFFRLLTDETRTANMTKSNGYNDVKDGDWFCCAVSTLSKMGIIKGYEDGSFKPNDPISRAEFAAIAARFDPDGDKTTATFADVTSHLAKDEISIAANHGWIKGYEDGSFKPDQKITRAETMTLVNRVLNRLPETKDDLHKDMKTWVDNMDETAWYYLAVQEATNSHYFKNKTSTKFEQWTDLRDTRDWSELEK